MTGTRVRVGFVLLGIVLVMSLAFAGWTFGAERLLTGVLLFFLYISFAGWPYWAAAIHTEGDDTRDRLSRAENGPHRSGLN
ncbi:hypothetical protein K8I85_10520 [bacterium]|nr:hypothetical protein [bacterium]